MREVGGSSGGEGSLIGGGGSILGIGSDIGGSLRCPAALCGISSLRPTKGRDISLIGMNAGNVDQIYPATVHCVSGFMSSSVSALVTGFKTMYNDEMLANIDNQIAPMPWKDHIYQSTRYVIKRLSGTVSQTKSYPSISFSFSSRAPIYFSYLQKT